MAKGITQHPANRPSLSSRGKVISIILLFSFITLILQSVIYLQGSIFDGVRSYVRGESLWAKAQKDAVLYLSFYSYSHSQNDYRAYQKAVLANLGDRKARLALTQTPPDRKAAREGLLEGNNSPLDVDSMIWFFLNFKHMRYLQEALHIWTQADAKIDELIVLGDDIRREVETNGTNSERLVSQRIRLQKLNQELLVLENNFSLVLGDGARWVRDTTWIVSISMLGIFILLGVVISHQIIKGITRSEKRLRASESRFRSLKESDTIGIVSYDLSGAIEEANDHFLNMLGYQEFELRNSGLNWRELTPDKFIRRDEQAIDEIIAHGRCEPYEKYFIARDGSQIPVYLGASSLGDGSQKVIAYVMDLSDRKKSEEQTRLAATAFAASNEGIMIIDKTRRIVSVNKALCKMTGYDEDELVGKPSSVLKSSHISAEQYKIMFRSLRDHGLWQGDVIDINKNGTLMPIRISISSVEDREQQVTHYVAILSDISERKAREEQLRQLAHYDTLTGLPNRALLYDRIEQLSKNPELTQNKFALLFFDLDNFKPVNDRHGHLVGDKLLQEVARRLSNSIRGIDMVTRLGGDEFIVLLENITDVQAIKEIRDKIVKSICDPCRIDGKDVSLSVSVGTSIYPEDGTDAESLLHQADIAMYGMKEGHQGTTEL